MGRYVDSKVKNILVFTGGSSGSGKKFLGTEILLTDILPAPIQWKRLNDRKFQLENL